MNSSGLLLTVLKPNKAVPNLNWSSLEDLAAEGGLKELRTRSGGVFIAIYLAKTGETV